MKNLNKERILHLAQRGNYEGALQILNQHFVDLDFGKNIKNWKELFGYKSIREMLSESERLVLHLFFQTNFAQDFLCRKTIEFDKDREPIYHKYEENIYDQAAASPAFYIPYHADNSNVRNKDFKKTHPKSKNSRMKFADSPSAIGQNIYIDQIIKNAATLPSSQTHDVYLVNGLANRIDIKRFINNINNDNFYKINTNDSTQKDYSYLIMPYRESGHAFAVVALINQQDPNKKECEAILLMNSLSNHPSNAMYEEALLGGWQSIFKTEKVPIFINASLDLQYKILNEGSIDENCVIYSSDIAEAFIKLIQTDSEIHEKLLGVVDSKNLDAGGELIQNSIKKHLPIYYEQKQNGEYAMKSSEEVGKYFALRRFDVASQFLKNKPFKP